MKTYLAFDLGATSGRAVAISFDGQTLTQQEIHRFPNRIQEIHGKSFWNIYALLAEFEAALFKVSQANLTIESIGIDTWGVDIAYIDRNGDLLAAPRAYRDPYTHNASEQLFNAIPADEVYASTGIQTLTFNTLFQLFAARLENYTPYQQADKILFMPDALGYLLTGKMACEYTIASTSQFLNAENRTPDERLLEAVGITHDKFPPIVQPGTLLGTLLPEISSRYGLPEIPIVTVAGHDTASAILAIPTESRNFAYLSSGTWSLIGIEIDHPILTPESCQLNFTNEGGVEGTIRYLKNITGMWILEQYLVAIGRKGKTYSYPEIVALLSTTPAPTVCFDPDHSLFATPPCMQTAITDYCAQNNLVQPKEDNEFFALIFHSLADKSAKVLDILRRLTPHPIERLHIIGGGSRNEYLNQLIADKANIEVIAGPTECTALGNALMQIKALGGINTLEEMRRCVVRSVETKTFKPTTR